MRAQFGRYVLLVFLFLLLSVSGFCSMEFKNLSTSDGLSNRRVLSMAKDGKGYSWFATRLAVDRYDGDKFVSYRLSDNEKIRGVISDRKGRIYAFTEKSVYEYVEREDAFRLQGRLKQIGLKVKDATINSIFFDIQNRLWICSASGLYYSSNFKNWLECRSLRNISVFSIVGNEDGVLWMGTSNGIFQVSQLKSNELYVSRLSELSSLKNTRIQTLYYDKMASRLWIGTFSEGLFSYSIAANRLTKDKQSQTTTPPIRSIASVSETEVWVGYDGLGIFVYDRSNATYVKNYTQSNNEELGSNSIYFICGDKLSTTVCTYTAGVFIHDRSKVNYRLLAPSSSSRNSNRADCHINAIFEDSDGEIWCGTNNGLRLYNSETNTWKTYLPDGAKGGKSNAVILTLYEDRQKNIWVGGFSTDLICINKRTKQVRKIGLPVHNMYHAPQNYIYSIVEDQEGDIWLGGAISKLLKYDVASGKCEQYDVKGINKILEINSKTLVLGTVSGVFYFDKRTGRHQRLNFRTLSKDKDVPAYPFINNIVRDIANSSVLWIGTDGNGLFRYNMATQELMAYTTSSGLSSNYVYGVLYDRFNRLWVSTERGLNCLNINRGKSIFSFQELPENTFNFLAYCKLKNGNMLWGTPNGVLEISPEKVRNQSDAAFNLRFNALYVYYEKMVAGEQNSPLNSGIDEAKSVVLGYNQRSFSFDFFNVSVPVKPNVVYSWKLEGFDKYWSAPTSEHKAVYTNIPSGRYTFLVKAINKSSGEESEVRRIAVRVLPPFWASPIAYIVYLMLLVGVIVLLAKLYRNKVEANNSEEKINFFVNMAHDIRIPITLIKAPLNEIEQESLSESGMAALKLAQRNTQKLFNMVSQLLDFQKVGLSAVGLHVEETDINHFINEIVYNFTLLAKEKDITIDLKTLNEQTKVWIDRQKLSLVMENLLSNAIKYTAVGGNAQVTLRLSPDGWLLVEVSDDGIGIPNNVQDKIFNRFFRAENSINSNEVGSGIGLLLTQKLVKLHKGRISFVSHEKCGSSFKVELPSFKHSYSSFEIIENEVAQHVLEAEVANPEEDKKMKILFVEDNDELREYLVKLLGREFKVEQASNGEEAMAMIMQEAPDFILSDVIMPKMSGIDLCSKLKGNIETCHIPIILLTSLSDREDIIKGLNAGADDYITKPFDLSILTNKIRNILYNRSLFKQKLVDKEALGEQESHLNELDKEFMHRVILLVEENMSKEEFSIETLSSDLAMSRSVFFKKIKALTGQSPVDLVKDIRMKKAAVLLREKRYSVNEIAYLTGFPNPKYFSTAFKKYYGNTPTSFLEKDKPDTSV